MVWILLALLLLALLVLPGVWVKQVLRRHAGQRDDFPGTGGDMAQHLIGKLGLEGVRVEETAGGDHYDPSSRCVRLTKDKLEGKTLTAVVVAAHEVGHALQHARGEALFNTRTGLAHVAIWMQRIAPVALVISPLMATVAPGFARLTLILAVASMLMGTLMHLVTLPVEWDASFGKALPALEQGEYLGPEDMRNARKILTAAALTYVAGSLMSLLNLGRWLRYLRR
ncbi:MAG: peptidase [Oceanospirillaceae bacterium]|nr:peptidase [Oceanospirillaceae bacterium]MBT11097.1 peptidase [Oceanospirillaceae bacterium]|tara:strand:+ start:41314 stop:41991 length:678 start_codon:yes stop_codon:yes gene_type:complete